MKLDPGIHIAMHSVLSLKPGVTNINSPVESVHVADEDLSDSSKR